MGSSLTVPSVRADCGVHYHGHCYCNGLTACAADPELWNIPQLIFFHFRETASNDTDSPSCMVLRNHRKSFCFLDWVLDAGDLLVTCSRSAGSRTGVFKGVSRNLFFSEGGSY